MFFLAAVLVGWIGGDFVYSRLTDFDEIWHDDAYWPPYSHLENHKNRDISATVWPIITKFGTLMQNGSLNCPDC